jgi:uncharacterized membrane protein
MSTLPGTGIVLGILTIFLLGLIMSSGFVQRVYDRIELFLLKIPLVKTLYTTIKELTRFLAPEPGGKRPDKVVVVKLPNIDMEIIGFVLRTDLSALPDELEKQDRVAVYIPMSYQVGGFTVFIPKTWLKSTSLSVEEAMKCVLVGWMSSDTVKIVLEKDQNHVHKPGHAPHQ